MLPQPQCSEASSIDSYAFASMQLLLDRTRKHPPPSSSSRIRRPKSFSRCPSEGGRRHHGSRRKGRRTLNYLKPGALAQLRDARRNALSSSCCVKRKIAGMNEEKDAEDAHNEPAMAVEMTPGPFVRVFAPLCPQRKKLLAPKAPLIADTPGSLRHPVATPSSVNVEVAAEAPSESFLEALPLELLVRIVCSLHHDQLRPAFHVCKRLRQAVMIARQCHFDFTTPSRGRQEPSALSSPVPDQVLPFTRGAFAGGPLTRPPTPKAPRPAPKPPQARISLAEMQQLAAPLFQSSSRRLLRVRPPSSLPRSSFRAMASHRVLFYEEELCQAVAQNSI